MTTPEATRTARALVVDAHREDCYCYGSVGNWDGRTDGLCVEYREKLAATVAAALEAAGAEAQEEIERLRAEMGYHEAKDVIEQLAAERDAAQRLHVEALDAWAAERDALAARVRELEAALRWIAASATLSAGAEVKAEGT